MNKVRIKLSPTQWLIPKIEMIIDIPKDRDEEEYIDFILDAYLKDVIRYDVEWDFV